MTRDTERKILREEWKGNKRKETIKTKTAWEFVITRHKDEIMKLK